MKKYFVIATFCLFLLAPFGQVWAQDSGLSDLVQSLKNQAKKQPPVHSVDVSHHAKTKRSVGTVTLDVFVCAGSGATEATIYKDIQVAQDILGQCGVSLIPGNIGDIRLDNGSPCPSNFRFQVNHNSGEFSDSQRWLYNKYRAGTADHLTAFYLPMSSQGPIQAGTSVPRDYAYKVKNGDPLRDQAVGTLELFQRARDNMNGGAPYTLAHEIGHILLDTSEHSSEAGNLMNPNTNAPGLDPSQCRTIAASPFVKR